MGDRESTNCGLNEASEALRFKLWVLVDNYTYIDQYYLGEPAVSYYIEADGKKILFDTGYSDIVLENARKMGIDLSGLTHIVLSHGHNDHTRGLKYLSRAMDLSGTELIAHPDCFLRREIDGESIGAPFTETEIAKICRYRPQSGPLELSEHCIYLGQIPQSNPFEIRKQIGRIEEEPDYVWDDSALAIKTREGLYIVTGCSHSGICNITEYARKVCGEGRIAGIIGGFHLFEIDAQLQETIRYLSEAGVHELYPCHCVSLKAKAEMMKTLSQVGEVGVGMVLER